MSTDLTIFNDDGFVTTMKIAEALVKSGILPRGIDNPFKAFAIIQKGREIGVGPMRALTGIALIEGKPAVSPELKLEQFRGRGGRVRWIKSDNSIAHLYLKATNGDEHEEIVTIEDMQRAGVASKDNWKRYPKSMLRARAVGFGLRAIGEGDGTHTPDELGAETDEEGNATYIPPPSEEAMPTPVPVGPNVPKLRRGQARPGAIPYAHAKPKVQAEVEAMDAEYNAVVNGVSADPPRGNPPQAKIIDDKTVEVWDAETGEVTQQPRPSPTRFKRLQSLRSSLDIKEPQWRKALEQYRVDSSNLLSQAQCEHLIQRLERWADTVREVKGKVEGLDDDETNRANAAPTQEEMEKLNG